MTRHGYYQSMTRYPYLMRYRDLWEDQVRRGFRTATLYDDAPELFDPNDLQHGFAMMVEEMLEVGLLSVDCPVLTFANPEDAAKAQGYATRPWPELIISAKDDPNAEHIQHVEAECRAAHEHGFRAGTHISGAVLHTCPDLANALDVWIVTTYTWEFMRVLKADERNKEVWACYHWDLSREPQWARMLTGLWCYSHKPKCLLCWSFCHSARVRILPTGTISDVELEPDDPYLYSYGIPTPQGPPMVTVGYREMQAGIEDYVALEWAEQHDDAESALFRSQIHGMFNNRFGLPTERLPTCDEQELHACLRALKQRVLAETGAKRLTPELLGG